MTYIIKEWKDIKQDFRQGSLLLGNGSSIAIDSRFGYQSILQHARDNDFLTEDIQKLFDFFRTSDFELILRLVWHASKVNDALQIEDEDKRTYDAYISVRDCLIKSVRNIHSNYQEVSNYLPAIYSFLRHFETVLSLNYDLIVYWAIMFGMNIDDQHAIKDCFTNTVFKEDWSRLREPIRNTKSTTLIFYPHGSLALCRNLVGTEFKISSDNHPEGLLTSILESWKSGKVVPLFVSEGTSDQKIKSIQNSNYLNTIYRDVLTSLESNMVIYGWGFGDQDLYILKRIASSQRIKSVAVSVFNNDQAYCQRVHSIIKQELGLHTEVTFFNSNSPGCWNRIAI